MSSPVPASSIPMADYVARSMSYADYRALIDRLIAEGRTTGPNQSEALADFTRLNCQRMKRLDLTVMVEKALVGAMQRLAHDWVWLTLTEAWCGDAAQAIPVIDKIAALSPRVRARYLLRDEHPALMDRYLTNGTRSIPKLLCLDAKTLEDQWTWGPRPAPAMALFRERAAQGEPKSAILEEVQRW